MKARGSSTHTQLLRPVKAAPDRKESSILSSWKAASLDSSVTITSAQAPTAIWARAWAMALARL